MRSEQAIILFVREQRHEAAVKPLPAAYRARGYAWLNRRIAARLAPLLGKVADLIVVSNDPLAPGSACARLAQHGNSFGERFGNAIADTLRLGYSRVVVIGNDCPELDIADITAAFDALAGGARMVAAPARDGGAFLIGARAENFSPAEIAGLPWCTSRLFAALVARPGTMSLAVVREDFDTWNGRRACDALAAIFGCIAGSLGPRVTSRPARTASSMKALSRIHLPAPPTA